MTPLDEGLARRRDLYRHKTQQTQETDTHAPGGYRTRNLSKRAEAELRLRLRDRQYRPVVYCGSEIEITSFPLKAS